MLVVIGPNWLSATNEKGQRRLDNPNDLVRIEIATALQRNISVIPLMLGNTSVPSGSNLPKDIAALAYQQAITIRPAGDFDRDVQRLIDKLKNEYQIQNQGDNQGNNIENLQQKAKQWNTDAQYKLGLLYLEGKGTDKNEHEAFELFNRAAAKGHANALFQLALMYLHGWGTAQNEPLATRYFRMSVKPLTQSSEQGDVEAQYKLGVMYDEGRGVEKDYIEAICWYRLAAEQGHAEAQYQLGQCYDKGYGVQKDQKEAMRWYRLAAAQGHDKAANMLRFGNHSK
jgi:TPR repeat protein